MIEKDKVIDKNVFDEIIIIFAKSQNPIKFFKFN